MEALTEKSGSAFYYLNITTRFKSNHIGVDDFLDVQIYRGDSP
jgi:hypothetical protein